MALTPIETVYNGYRMRSRLEARWALFFDALGVEYAYEPEGYYVGGTPYLPDFWLPKYRSWVEVKGQQPNEHEKSLMYGLVLQAEDAHGHLVWGLPGEGWLRSFYWTAGDSGGVLRQAQAIRGICRDCGQLAFRYFLWMPAFWDRECTKPYTACPRHSDDVSTDSPRLLSAYAAARQARFEHEDYFGLRRVPTLAV